MATSAVEDTDDGVGLTFHDIPRKYTERELVMEVSRYIHPSEFNFVYVPSQAGAKFNEGYALMNFVSVVAAGMAVARLAGREWSFSKSKRRISAHFSTINGIVTHLRRFAPNALSQPGTSSRHAPWVFEKGVRLSLSAAVSKFCPELQQLPQQPSTEARPFAAVVSTGADFFENDDHDEEEFRGKSLTLRAPVPPSADRPHPQPRAAVARGAPLPPALEHSACFPGHEGGRAAWISDEIGATPSYASEESLASCATHLGLYLPPRGPGGGGAPVYQ